MFSRSVQNLFQPALIDSMMDGWVDVDHVLEKNSCEHKPLENYDFIRKTIRRQVCIRIVSFQSRVSLGTSISMLNHRSWILLVANALMWIRAHPSSMLKHHACLQMSMLWSLNALPATLTILFGSMVICWQQVCAWCDFWYEQSSGTNYWSTGLFIHLLVKLSCCYLDFFWVLIWILHTLKEDPDLSH